MRNRPRSRSERLRPMRRQWRSDRFQSRLAYPQMFQLALSRVLVFDQLIEDWVA